MAKLEIKGIGIKKAAPNVLDGTMRWAFDCRMSKEVKNGDLLVIDAEAKRTVAFLINECQDYFDRDDFEWHEESKTIKIWCRPTESYICIPHDEFLQVIDEYNSLKISSDGCFVRTKRRTSRIVIPISTRAHIASHSDKKLIMNLEDGTAISLKPMSFWVTVAALKSGAYDADFMPAESYRSVELYYPLSAERLSEKEEEGVIDSFLFELAASENFIFQKAGLSLDHPWDNEEDDSEFTPKFRPLESFNEGMRLFLAAVPIEDPELRLLSLFKVLEFFAPIVLALDGNEALRKKLDSPLALSPNANYLKSIFDLVESLDERKSDSQMIRLLFETCLDFVELSKMLPHPSFNEINYADKKTNIDAQLKAAAEALVATRNQVAHAKSDYKSTGSELPLNSLPDFNEFLEAAAVQTIRWYNRLPTHLKLKF